ncbi:MULTISPECIES: hypothetical protein [unclassified Leifsonia]|uniref:hypothetical protein n=1 Tax=unclassified Leifsonia TaxID=2663824 RepID=UPI0008A740BD|nr:MULTISPECIES: hypothetical protein [unclassified Leifsonia]SEH56822.1 hypothetical protein SAMN04515694_101142 [Leifsonia sp. CL154]SFL22026.1 hypothetical protein SAMN04515692_101337 [Leifsonia sp. CL147]
MTRVARAPIIGALVLAAVGAGLAGCTPASPHPAPTGAASTATRTPSTGLVQDLTHQPGSQKDYVGALKDVTVTSCDTGSSPAAFKGKVTNPTTSEQSYRIYVSILAGGNTLGISEVDIAHVPANTTKTWTGSLKLSSPGARCVLRVERTDNN